MTAALTVPGVGVHDLTDDEYFTGELARTSLSSTGVRELLVCPAKFRHNQQHPRPPKRTFDVGHAAHQLVLGAGPELVVIEAEEWRSKAVKEEVEAVRARGAVPLRPSDWLAVVEMAKALTSHPLAPKLLTRGQPEKTLIWRDEKTDVLCRAKADYLRADGIVDYKTCDRADTDSLTRTVHGWGYYAQAAWYLRGMWAALPRVSTDVPFFAFVAQEKDAPYLVHVFQLSDRALTYGDRRCDEALEKYRDCVAADEWPGYPCDDITEIDLPGWVRTEEYS
jgi:hypothetical protein